MYISKAFTGEDLDSHSNMGRHRCEQEVDELDNVFHFLILAALADALSFNVRLEFLSRCAAHVYCK